MGGGGQNKLIPLASSVLTIDVLLKYLDKKLTRKTSNTLKSEKTEDIAVKRYNQGRHHTEKSVQYFFTAEQKGVKT